MGSVSVVNPVISVIIPNVKCIKMHVSRLNCQTPLHALAANWFKFIAVKYATNRWHDNCF